MPKIKTKINAKQNMFCVNGKMINKYLYKYYHNVKCKKIKRINEFH